MTDPIDAFKAAHVNANAGCARDGCSEIGLWHPIFVIHPKFPPGRRETYTPIRAVLGLVVCDQHKQESTVEHFVSDQGWTMICDAIEAQGGLRPDRSKLALDFDPVIRERV